MRSMVDDIARAVAAVERRRAMARVIQFAGGGACCVAAFLLGYFAGVS